MRIFGHSAVRGLQELRSKMPTFPDKKLGALQSEVETPANEAFFERNELSLGEPNFL